MNEGPAISLEKISKRFGDGPLVLDEISISAGPGDIVALVGPSGCGKSTLLRIIASLIPSSSGAIRHAGAAIDAAFIFQDATLLPWATVRENIVLPHRLKGTGTASRESIALDWGRRMGLSHALDYYPRELSGGMRMRVSIARALSLSPNLLLLDEPFGALDAITRNRLNEELLALRDQAGWTAFFVTHSVNEAVFLSHKVVIMGTSPGRIATVINNPLPFPRDSRTRESLEFQQRVAEATGHLREVLTA